MIRRPPRFTLFPSATLYRSLRYYGTVRLPVPVHRRRMSLGLSRRGLRLFSPRQAQDLPVLERSEYPKPELQTPLNLACRLPLEECPTSSAPPPTRPPSPPFR